MYAEIVCAADENFGSENILFEFLNGSKISRIIFRRNLAAY